MRQPSPPAVADLIKPGRVRAPGLALGGVVPFTTVDYPGELAAVLFCQGCPWRCDYCHNPHLWAAGLATLEWDGVLQWLAQRRGFLDAVVLSGGEPTAQGALPDVLPSLRALGFHVGLHTAGCYPKQLKRVLPLLDWVAVDVKATPSGYTRLTHARGSGERAWMSVRAVVESGRPAEFRTTIHPVQTDEAAIREIATRLASLGATTYVLQAFRPQGCADACLTRDPPLPLPLSTRLRDDLAKMFPHFLVRGDLEFVGMTS